MSYLFSAFSLRGVEFRNRVFVSPMCQYSSRDGMPNDWHMVHLGSRAVGGAALVMAEATSVSPEGRISPGDTGIWSDAHAQAFALIAAFIKSQGAVPAIQLAHAGRKASTEVPWRGGKALTEDEGAWQTLAPSALAFGNYHTPVEMTAQDIERVTREFEEAARRSLEAGFEVAEIHMAHGYLLHEFLSPLSNRREDEFGGSIEGRMRFPLRVADAVRRVWPERLPLFARISATDWVEGGWDLEHSMEFSRRLREAGVDLIDCSSGGLVPGAKITVGPGYQVPFAARIREEAKVATGAVGLITEAHQAEEIISQGKADVVFLARAMLRDPYWALHAANTLGADIQWPVQYERAKD
ncbi:MAG TPA: NADH:flavin oxidoreductase/NADH oxidase [Pyrinomonadaceae bacterium]|jgi:2,4-dienoyl-CoA reductase-like NADH-dependent reductase (Old Yellow Enzyme family)